MNYSRLHTQLLGSFNSGDVRKDKKINLKKIFIELFIDVTNWYVKTNQAIHEYNWQRAANNKTFKTTDGPAIEADGDNTIPTRLKHNDPGVYPWRNC